MTKASAKYESDDILIEFSGYIEEYEEGNIVRDIDVTSIHILGVECSWTEMQEYEALATAVLAQADEVEFEATGDDDDDDDGEED